MRVYLNVDTIVLICYHQRITRAELSRDAKITPEYLGQILHRGYCGAKTADKIADALGLQLDQVVLPRVLQIPSSDTPYYKPKRFTLRAGMVYLNRDVIYGIMKAKSITFAHLSDALGGTRQNVHYQIHRGHCRRDFAQKIAGALGVSVDTIILKREESQNEAL